MMPRMIPNSFKRRRKAAAVLALCVSASAAAQVPLPHREDPGESLSRHLRTLSDEPRNLASLIGAGDAALSLGDTQSAVTFFARAEEVAPRDGRVKAKLGAAFLQLEQPEPALKFFGEAVSLGIPEREIAGDRGLAYDLTGDSRRAQRDYQFALAGREDPELHRRLALSLAISGERDPALKAIEAQLRAQDRAGWRTRAFVLALTGDVVGASRGVDQAMPGQGAAMQPFLARLATLRPADRAAAVHFGRFPGDQPMQMADAGSIAYSSANTAATQSGRPDNAQSFGSSPTAVPSARTALPGVSPARSGPIDGRQTRVFSTPPTTQPRSTAPSATQPRVATPPPIRTARAGPRPNVVATIGTPPAAPLAPRPTSVALAPSAAPGFSIVPGKTAAPTSTRLADIAAAITTLSDLPPPPIKAAAPKPTPAKVTPTEKSPTKLASAEVKKPATPPAKKAAAKPTPPRAPSRHWVQIAGGAEKADLDRSFAQLKTKAPKLLGGWTPWTTPLRFTNRLLVGPFKSEEDAQAFVNQLAKADVPAFSWTSPAGQEIVKLALK